MSLKLRLTVTGMVLNGEGKTTMTHRAFQSNTIAGNANTIVGKIKVVLWQQCDHMYSAGCK